MLRGIYTAASGMLVQSVNTDVISNNLANVDTVGYHRQSAHVRSFPALLLKRELNNDSARIGTLGTGAVIDGSRSSFTPGSIHSTGNALDTALIGPGFYSVDTPEGVRYTRDGRFTLNSTGWLVTHDGNRVRGENGPILVRDGDVTIRTDGTILVNEEIRDRLLMVEFPNRDGLVKQGANLYRATEEAGLAFRYNSIVHQGSLEMANVNVIREMVNLIEVHRSYEANQKVVQAYDETLGKAVNEIAGR